MIRLSWNKNKASEAYLSNEFNTNITLNTRHVKLPIVRYHDSLSPYFLTSSKLNEIKSILKN